MRSTLLYTILFLQCLSLSWASSSSLRTKSTEGMDQVDQVDANANVDAEFDIDLEEYEEEVQRFLGDDSIPKPKPHPHPKPSTSSSSSSSSSGTSASASASKSSKKAKSPAKQSINVYFGMAAVGAAAIVAAYHRRRSRVVGEEQPSHPLAGSLARRGKAFEAFVNAGGLDVNVNGGDGSGSGNGTDYANMDGGVIA